jgi:hypothetical protein
MTGGTFGAFAGRWVDQEDGGRLVIALRSSHPDYTDARARVLEQSELLVSEGRLDEGDLRIVEVEFGADDVYEVNATFARRYLEAPEVEPLSVRMSVSVNLETNTADLYAEPAWLDEAEAFAEEFPAGLVRIVPVEEGSLVSITGG